MAGPRQIDVAEIIEQQRWGGFGARLLILSCLVTFVDGFDMQGISYLAPYLASDFGLSKRELGTLFTSGVFGAMVGGPICGLLGDRFGRRPTLVVTTLLAGILTAALVFAKSFEALVGLRFVGGIMIGGLLPVCWALNIDYAPRARRSTVIVLVMIGYFAGSTVAGPLTVWLAPTHGWQALWLLGGVATILSGVALAVALPESARYLARRGHNPRKLVRILSSLAPQAELSVDDRFIIGDEGGGAAARPFRLSMLFEGDLRTITPFLWLAYIASSLTVYFASTWGPTLYESIGFTRTQAAYISTTGGITSAILGLVIGRLIDRRGPTVLALIPMVAAPLYLLLGWVVVAPLATAATAICANALAAGSHSGMHSIAGRFYPSDRRGNGAGWATSVAKIGSVAAPWLGGIILSSNLPVRRAFLFVAACPIVLGISILVVAAALRRRPAAVD